MKLNELLQHQGINFASEVEVSGITCVAQEVEAGNIFFAIEGIDHDGNDYIDIALQRGAVLVISAQPSSNPQVIVVDNIKVVLNEMIAHYYAYFYHKMTFIGITGTNGKTSTASFIYQSLKLLAQEAMLIGTNGIYFADKYYESHNTTPEFSFLIKYLYEAYQNNIRIVVMEVSSHALKLQRLHDVMFDIAIFTNLTPEHLDFHHTMEDYLATKLTLFMKVKRDGTSIINGDDHYAPYFYATRPTSIVVGTKFKTNHLAIYEDEYINLKIDDLEIKSQIYGTYNGYNLAFCYFTLKALGFIDTKIVDAIAKIHGVEGRLDAIYHNRNTIIIDFAHTPDALENVLRYLKTKKFKRIISLFGCGGNRDTQKRPMMLEVVQKYSDLTIICDDNPRHEKSIDIIRDILKGIISDHVYIISSRKQAIEFAIKIMAPDECLVIFGKGHEKYQIIGDVKHLHSDYEEVNKWIK